MILLRHGESEFNVIYSATGQDPGIRDPRLTERGHGQAREAAQRLTGHGVKRTLASPFTRALDWPDHGELVVVSHWGFILALTGHSVANCEMVFYDPHHCEPA